ncbi:MAG: HD domain-containing protein [Acidobacteria bacterium]|nr:HD domain-containing protein [Acidobacteriota bacterium]
MERLRKRVQMLIVDNDRSVVEAIQNCFPSSRYHCTTTTRAEGALELMKHTRFRVVISPARLHGMSGTAFLHRGRMRNPHAAFLVLANQVEGTLAAEALQNGASGCIYRPFEPEDICASVERVLKQQELRLTEEIFDTLSTATLRKRVEHLHNVLQQSELPNSPTLDLLIAGLDSRQSEMNLHSLRVRNLCVLLAERCGYSKEKVPKLAESALLHDIGKIAVPASILLKPGKLTQQEFEVVKQHTRLGHQVLSRIPHLQHAADVALSHHERVDGTGYPFGLTRDSISLEARIFAVADTADVITAGRPYSLPRTMAQARAELARCSGSQFDADVVDVFLTISDQEWQLTREEVRRQYQALQPFFKQPAAFIGPLQQLAQ